MSADLFTWLAGAVLLTVGAVAVLTIAVALYGAAIVRRLDAILDELRRLDRET